MRRFEKSLPMQLLRARELIMQRMRPHLSDLGMTDPQWRVIRALSEQERMTIAQLSNRCVLHPASLSRIIPSLEADGLVVRCASRLDRRAVVLKLTDEGMALFRRISPIAEDLYAAFVERVGPDCVAMLYDALEVFMEEVGRVEPERADNVIPRSVRRRQASADLTGEK